MKNSIPFHGVVKNISNHLKILIASTLLISSIGVFGQEMNDPQAAIYEMVEQETPKRGVYLTYAEFLNNAPSIIDSFYVNESPRSKPIWQGTYAVEPRYAAKNKKVKKVWGFSDGQQAFIFNELEFFPIIAEGNELVFYGYDRVDNSGATAAGVMGGAIGGGIAASAALSKAKSQKIRYTIQSVTGTAVHPNGTSYESAMAAPEKMKELIIYRRSRNESDEVARFIVDETQRYSFEQKSYVLLKYPVSANSASLCTGADFKDCMTVKLNAEETTYVECTYLTNTEKPQLILQDESQGEFDYFKISDNQDKRGVQKPEMLD